MLQFLVFGYFLLFSCVVVSSMLSGLETRSLGLNTLGTTESAASSHTVCPSQSYVHSFMGLSSTIIITKQGINVTCSRPLGTGTRPGLEPGTPWSIVCDANHCINLMFLTQLSMDLKQVITA